MGGTDNDPSVADSYYSPFYKDQNATELTEVSWMSDSILFGNYDVQQGKMGRLMGTHGLL